ncbi:MAG: toll/interleukin-1 receptor domain-containing protein [Burkholderiales bacterium]
MDTRLQITSSTVGDREPYFFISYSHHDTELAKKFRVQLVIALESKKLDKNVFFDRDGIKAGDDWSEKIQEALERATHFVYLVSADSLNSKICRDRELGFAVLNRLRVISVIVRDVIWSEIPLPDGRTLGALDATPHLRGHIVPVRGNENSQWSDPDTALTIAVGRVLETLSTKAESTSIASNLSPAPRPSRDEATVPRVLLPYFCNQKDVVGEFRKGIESWTQGALVVFAKGVWDDAPDEFWKRLRDFDLTEVRRALNLSLESIRVLQLDWPDEFDHNQIEALDTRIRESISRALTKADTLISSAEQLGEEIRGQSGISVLFAHAPKQSRFLMAACMRSMLRLFESCQDQPSLAKLIVVVVVAQENMVDHKLCAECGLEDFRYTKILELSRLKVIDAKDLETWYSRQRLMDVYGIQFSAVEREFTAAIRAQRGTVGGLFASLTDVISGKSPGLRMRPFAERVVDRILPR